MLKAPAKRGRKKEPVEEVKPKAKAAGRYKGQTETTRKQQVKSCSESPRPEPEPIVEEAPEEAVPAPRGGQLQEPRRLPKPQNQRSSLSSKRLQRSQNQYQQRGATARAKAVTRPAKPQKSCIPKRQQNSRNGTEMEKGQ